MKESILREMSHMLLFFFAFDLPLDCVSRHNVSSR